MQKILLGAALLAVASYSEALAGWFIVPLGAVWHTSSEGKRHKVTVVLQRGEDTDTREVSKGQAPGDIKEVDIIQGFTLPAGFAPQWYNGVVTGPGTFRTPGAKTISLVIDRNRPDQTFLVGIEIPDNHHGKTLVRFDQYPRLAEDQPNFLTTVKKGRDNYSERLFRVTRSPAGERIIQFADPPPNTETDKEK